MEFGSRVDLEDQATRHAFLRCVQQAIKDGKSDERMCRMFCIDQAQLDAMRLEIQQRDRANDQ